MNISLSLNGDTTSLDTIKYCALYFDKIAIDTHFHIHTVEELEKRKSKNKPVKCCLHFLALYDTSLHAHTKILEEEGILKYVSPAMDTFLSDEHTAINLHAKEIIGANIHKLFEPSVVSTVQHEKKKSGVIVTGNPKPIIDEAIEAYSNIFSTDAITDLIKYKFDGDCNGPIQFYCLLSLYSGLFEEILHHICIGEHIVTNSGFINDVLKSFYAEQRKKNKIPIDLYNQIAMDCMSMLLPYIKSASMEDILELRFQAKDELMELKNYIDTFISNLNVDVISQLTPKEIRMLTEEKIVPSIKQFERKMKSIQLTALQNAIRNPVYYVPLITSVLSNLPQQIAFLSSLSLIALDSVIGYRKLKNDLKNDALYFTVKLK